MIQLLFSQLACVLTKIMIFLQQIYICYNLADKKVYQDMTTEKTDTSTYTLISKFLKRQKAGKTFVYADFDSCGSYSCIRSAVMRLCEKKELLRLCQGVYMKPGADTPDDLHIANEIARRNNTLVKIKNDEIIGGTRVITLYTNGATRNITLPDGTIIKYYHSRLE